MASNNPSLNDFENRLWTAADELRANSKMRASEYSTPVLGLIFLRYADVKFAAVRICFNKSCIQGE
ncbi:MAG: type I restriction-modification system subunit M N-terminal domain-containing protein [Anaerolineales bacterium]